ncbi:MAG: hypothetical protein WA364_27960 [Candidatus Nitrosopolaris sp.]
MLWEVNIEISCRPERLKELCDLLNTHRCVMLAKPVIEEGEVVKGGGAPIIFQSPNSRIECEALVLHQSEEDDLLRHLKKVLGSTESLSIYPSDKGKVLRKHIMKIGGITASILFAVVIVELLALARDRPLTLADTLIGAGSAAFAAFVIEVFIIAREHNL